MWDVSSNFDQRFEEALEWHRARAPVTPDQYRRLSDWAKRRAFTVAGVSQLDAVTAVFKALQKALEDGTGFEDFKRDLQSKMIILPEHRLNAIWRNNIQTAYAAGRHKQMTEPAVLAARPYWMFDAVMDPRTSRICRAVNGKVYPADSPFWKTHYPPLHGLCRSGVRTLTTQEAQEHGISTTAPTEQPDPGWGSNDFEWSPDPSRYPPELWAAFQGKHNLIRYPAGTPVSHSLTVQQHPDMQESARALEIIDSVHGDGALPSIPLNRLRGSTDLGQYVHQRGTGRPVEINILASGSHKRMTTAHEVGHFLDHQVLDQPGLFASDNPSSVVGQVMHRIQQSQAFQELQRLQRERWFDAKKTVMTDPRYVSYLLRPREMFARAYAQYIAVQSADTVMLKELSKELNRTGKIGYYPKQWDEADFAPIRDAMTLMLVQKGWMQ